MVRYYGYYSNKSRGHRIKADQDHDIANILETGLSDKAFRKSWARLIQKVYEVDPLLCPECQGEMKIISFIEEPDVIKQILQHLGLWDIRNNGPPAPRLDIVQDPVYLPVHDHAPAGENPVFLCGCDYHESVLMFFLSLLKRPALPAQNAHQQHVVLKTILTHKANLAIDDNRKSNFLSFYLCQGNVIS